MNAVSLHPPLKAGQSNPNSPAPNLAIANRSRKRQQKQIRNSSIEKALELTVKITINSLLSLIAFNALNKLLPYHQVQQEKLTEIRLEVEKTEARVKHLREKFSGNFDPRQSKKVMEKNSYRVDPHTRPIFFLEGDK